MADNDDFLVETVEYAREHCNSNPYWSYDSSTRQELKSFLKGKKSKNKAAAIPNGYRSRGFVERTSDRK